jgi:hypothetical protein
VAQGDLLNDMGMLGCRPASTPIDPNHKLIRGISDQVDRGRYQRLVDRLLYLAHTRPNIAYAVSVISRYMHDPRVPHQEAMYQILRYLKSYPNKCVLFSKNRHTRIEVYTDADWVRCLDDRKSTSDYCSFVEGNLVS